MEYVTSSEQCYKQRKGVASRVRVVLSFAIIMALCFVALCSSVYAADYPGRTVSMLMPWSGGYPYNSARLYSEGLSDLYGESFVVVVTPGAGGEIAARKVIASDNPHTLLVTGSSVGIRAVSHEYNVNPLVDLQPIAQLTTSPYVIVAKAGRFDSIQQMINVAKKGTSDNLFYASAGVGTGMHYLGELMNAGLGIDMEHVPYESGSKEMHAVLSGNVDVAILSQTSALPQVKAGTLDVLAVSAAKRSPQLPDTPTLNEMPGLENLPPIGAWIGLFGPADMDEDVVQALSERIQAIAQEPGSIKTVRMWGADIPDASVKYFRALIQREMKLWKDVIEEYDLPVAG